VRHKVDGISQVKLGLKSKLSKANSSLTLQDILNETNFLDRKEEIIDQNKIVVNEKQMVIR
jgi:hypothetical protein